MLHSPRFIAILDANVLYPAPLRDYLLHLANVNLYKPKWTAQIQQEWITNLLLKRPDLKQQQLEKTQAAMDTAFPDSNITGYEELVNALSLPDKEDRHVLAAAIRANAAVIVTFNTKDFPRECLKLYDVEAQHPDEFVANLICLDKARSLRALYNQVKSLRNPPKSLNEVLHTLEACGLKKSVTHFKD